MGGGHGLAASLSALRLHLGDQLVTRGSVGMTLTPGGSRLLATASQIVVLGAEAHAAVRAAQGAPEQLRVVSTSTFAEFMISPLTEAFSKRFPGSVEVSAGVSVTQEMSVLVGNRLADVAISSAHLVPGSELIVGGDQAVRDQRDDPSDRAGGRSEQGHRGETNQKVGKGFARQQNRKHQQHNEDRRSDDDFGPE